MSTETQTEKGKVVDQKTSSNMDIEARLLEGDFENSDPEELFVDPTLLQIREARALIRMWHDMSAQLVEIKTGYRMARKWEDEELKTRFLEAGKPLISRIDILETSLKESLTPLKGVRFLEDQELRLLPKWVHTALGQTVSKVATNSKSN